MMHELRLLPNLTKLLVTNQVALDRWRAWGPPTGALLLLWMFVGRLFLWQWKRSRSPLQGVYYILPRKKISVSVATWVGKAWWVPQHGFWWVPPNLHVRGSSFSDHRLACKKFLSSTNLVQLVGALVCCGLMVFMLGFRPLGIFLQSINQNMGHNWKICWMTLAWIVVVCPIRVAF